MFKLFREEIKEQYEFEQKKKAKEGEDESHHKNNSSIIKIQLVIDACHSGSAIDQFNPKLMPASKGGIMQGEVHE